MRIISLDVRRRHVYVQKGPAYSQVEGGWDGCEQVSVSNTLFFILRFWERITPMLPSN